MSFTLMGPPCSCQYSQSCHAHTVLFFLLIWLKCTVTELTTKALLLILPPNCTKLNCCHIWKIIINKWPVLNTTFNQQCCLLTSHPVVICAFQAQIDFCARNDPLISMKWEVSKETNSKQDTGRAIELLAPRCGQFEMSVWFPGKTVQFHGRQMHWRSTNLWKVHLVQEVLCHLRLEFGRAFGRGIILYAFMSFYFWLLAETRWRVVQTFGLIQYGLS